MKRVCKSNPQLPPHEHHRKDGILICEGYAAMTKFEALKKAFPNAKLESRYVPE